MKRLRWTVVMLPAAVLLSGCGEMTNTLTPRPGTANVITVALDAPPNFTQAGIDDAEALGYLSQTDLKVRFIVSKHPINDLHDHRAQIALTSEPLVILARNNHTALAAVAAVLQNPGRPEVICTGTVQSGKNKGKTTTTTVAATPATTTSTSPTGTTTTTAPRSHPPLHAANCRTQVQVDSAYVNAPTYNELNFVVTENEIINHAPLLRRFVQAVGRGYAAVRSDPTQAAANLVNLHPNLNYSAELTGINATLSDFFPTGNKPWGWQTVKEWNAFGTWMLLHHLISNVNATPDADTNELLAGQGV